MTFKWVPAAVGRGRTLVRGSKQLTGFALQLSDEKKRICPPLLASLSASARLERCLLQLKDLLCKKQ